MNSKRNWCQQVDKPEYSWQSFARLGVTPAGIDKQIVSGKVILVQPVLSMNVTLIGIDQITNLLLWET